MKLLIIIYLLNIFSLAFLEQVERIPKKDVVVEIDSKKSRKTERISRSETSSKSERRSLIEDNFINKSNSNSKNDLKEVRSRKGKEDIIDIPVKPLKSEKRSIIKEDDNVPEKQNKNIIDEKLSSKEREKRLQKIKSEIAALETDSRKNNLRQDRVKSKEVIEESELITQHRKIKHREELRSKRVKIYKEKGFKSESFEFTLPEVTIDNTHRLEYYYPYFYKTHIFDYYDNFSSNSYSSDCLDLGCEYCDMATRAICKQCRHGFYSYLNKCFTNCPSNYVADIYKRTCSPFENRGLRRLVYLKAFTLGSCQNRCGMTLSDCSCQSSCVSSGNCCSDYHSCEYYEKNKVSSCLAGNCEICQFSTDSSSRCAKCKEGFYLKYGECVEKCGSNERVWMENRICLKIQDCRVDNCNECIEGNPAVCKKCANGFFLHNNICNESCPLKLRADRISWSCVETPVFAWYWVFPSRTSCRSRCGTSFSLESDCSCSEDCYRYGNCCQDYEDFCSYYVFWK